MPTQNAAQGTLVSPRFNRTRKLCFVLWSLIFVVLTLSEESLPLSSSEQAEESAGTVSHSEKTGSTISASLSSKGANRLLESLWETFKKSLEGSSTQSTSTNQQAPPTESSSTSINGKRGRHSQKGSNRRGILLEQTLRSHYTEQLVTISPFFEDYLLKSSGSSDGIGQSDTDKALRWHNIPSRGKKNADQLCYYYCKNVDDWCYMWCPNHGVWQGHRNANQNIDFFAQLGKFFQPTQQESQGDEDQTNMPIFLKEVQKQYTADPNSTTIEYYHKGNICESALSSRRMAAVVVHNDDSFHKCPLSWTQTLKQPAISSVTEDEVCKYTIHVCTPTMENDGTEKLASTTISEHEAEHLNQTINHIHEVIHAYLHQSESEKYQKSNPDRTTSLHVGLPPMPPSRVKANLDQIRDMFTHAYDGYMYNAFPASELKPLTCQPGVFNLVRLPALTLIDSMDMLIVLGNYTEFARSVERLRLLHQKMARENRILDNEGAQGGIFALNNNVSVFETNIRVLGGLLSAHQLAEAYIGDKVLETDVWDDDGKILVGNSKRDLESSSCSDRESSSTETTPPSEEDIDSSCVREREKTNDPNDDKTEASTYWSYDGFLLELAQDIGNRLLPAFETLTGIPYGTVNLLSGIPKGETTIASLAGGGTLSLEMELLSRLTRDPAYGQAAKLSARALWMRRTDLNLFGKHLCTRRGEWTESLSGIGSNSDSFYEYLIKHHILFPEDQDFWLQAFAAYGGVHNQSRNGEWYADVDMSHGGAYSGGKGVFEALMAFYPGMQVLLGELTPAARTLNSFFMVRELLGFLPERFNYGYWKVDGFGGKHHLRPELLESAYFLHRSTKGIYQQRRSSASADQSSGWQWASDFALHALEKQTRTICGYASVKELSPTTTGALPTSASKTKLMNEMPSFFLTETLKYLYLTYDEDNVLHTDEEREWVFTTEAHPIHYVPPSHQKNPTDKLLELKEMVKDRLRRRIRGEQGSSSFSWQLLDQEKWTDSSQLRYYVKRMEPVVQEVGDAHLSRRKDRMRTEEIKHDRTDFLKASTFIEPFLSSDQIYEEYDFFNETQKGTNVAHLTFSKLGHRHLLTKACPNFYASDLLWIRALNGGATDYSDAYMSTAYDEIGESNSRFFMLGAADALAMHGSGLHVIQVYDDSQRCLIGRDTPGTEHSGASVPANAQSKESTQKGKDRFAFGGELGSFDVSAFPAGSGFFIQHVESGETVIATLIDDVTYSRDSEESFVMIYLSPAITRNKESVSEATSTGGWRLSNYRWGSMFDLGKDEPDMLEDDSERSVVMADLNGNAYYCLIEIIHSGFHVDSSDPKDDNDEETEQSVVVARYPCAPALFGPTHMKELVRTGSIEVEAIIRAPQTGDDHGCNKIDPDLKDDHHLFESTVSEETAEEEGESNRDVEDSSEDKVIQLLHRGVCTFQEKALNQKKSFNAEAAIIINNEPEELFVMSGGGINGEPDDPNSYPVTVLVTGLDGESIIRILDTLEEDENLNLTARVSLTKQEASFASSDKVFSVSGNEYWPAVRTSKDALQIFAKGGWGVHAIQKATASGTSVEWQLYLMRHQ